jgi:hypothetical protein
LTGFALRCGFSILARVTTKDLIARFIAATDEAIGAICAICGAISSAYQPGAASC